MTKSHLKLVLVLMAGLLTASALSACNTTAGFGQDMKDAGQGLKNEANKDQ